MINALEMFNLKGKTAIVTGAASGIGRSMVDYLASAGANVCIVDLNIAKATEVAKTVAETFNVKTHAFYCDVSSEEGVDKLYEEIEENMGTCDVLLNNAGININGGALDLNFKDWKKVLNINIDGVFLMARGFAKKLIAKNLPGSVINIASMSASIVNLPQWQTAYNTSKAAVLHMTKTLAVEWVEHNIRVNAISPGYTWTEMNQVVPQDIQDFWMNAVPFHRYGQTSELAGAVIYYASNASTFTSGSELVIDGCFTCV